MNLDYDFQINFTVKAPTESEGLQTLHGLLNKAIFKYGLENVIEYKDFEFITQKSCDSGCGNNHCC
jgi:hypothetical protein